MQHDGETMNDSPERISLATRIRNNFLTGLIICAPLAITIKANGDVFIQTTQIGIDALGAQVQAIIGEGYDKPIYVRGDEATPYGTIMEVMAEIKAAGYTRVSLVTEQKK